MGISYVFMADYMRDFYKLLCVMNGLMTLADDLSRFFFNVFMVVAMSFIQLFIHEDRTSSDWEFMNESW